MEKLLKIVWGWLLLNLKNLSTNCAVLIDYFVKFSFYLLIFFSVAFAAFYLFHEFRKITYSIANEPNENEHRIDSSYSYAGKRPSDTVVLQYSFLDTDKIALIGVKKHELSSKDALTSDILKIAEHIFLCLLPCFTLLGFFTYYKDKSSFTLRDIISETPNNNNATSEMKAAKTLFISSLISYILIKVLEEIAENGCDTNRLIAYAILLVMLFLYYFFLDSHNTGESGSNNTH